VLADVEDEHFYFVSNVPSIVVWKRRLIKANQGRFGARSIHKEADAPAGGSMVGIFLW